MLNIVNLLKKNKINRILNKEGTLSLQKKDIPLIKEWYNAIYSFNKNSIRLYPGIQNYVFKLFKWHFNMINNNLQQNLKKDVIKSTDNKLWISTPEIKHLNKHLEITVYIYNRLYNYYRYKLNYMESTWGPTLKLNYFFNVYKKKSSRPKTMLIKSKNFTYWGKNKKSYKKNYFIKVIKWLKWDKYISTQQYKLNILQLINKDKFVPLKYLNILKIERYNYLINQFKKELIYLKLKQNILFNEFKFKELYLTPFIMFLQTIYNKKIILNIIVIKNYYLSSSILSQIIISKIKSKKNRGKFLNVMHNSVTYLDMPNISRGKIQKLRKLPKGILNIILNKYNKIDNRLDYLNEFLIRNNKSKTWYSNYIDSLILKNLENKSIAGICIKVKGRLTKRFKAQRALNIVRYTGTIKNVYSAYRGLSSSLSRGYDNINIEKTKINSKLRIGAFGVTGWVTSY